MLAKGAIVVVFLGIHYSLANYGCPDNPPDCWKHCNKTKGCLTGYCELYHETDCVCAGCSKDPKIRYRNYGCVEERRKKGMTVPTEAPKTKESILRNKIGKLLNSRRVLRPNIWMETETKPEVLKTRRMRLGGRKMQVRKGKTHH